MAKPLVNIFPKLRAKMGFNNHSTADLAEVLGISEDSVRRRLRGEVEFELQEIVKLILFYNCTFEDLFGNSAA